MYNAGSGLKINENNLSKRAVRKTFFDVGGILPNEKNVDYHLNLPQASEADIMLSRKEIRSEVIRRNMLRWWVSLFIFFWVLMGIHYVLQAPGLFVIY